MSTRLVQIAKLRNPETQRPTGADFTDRQRFKLSSPVYAIAIAADSQVDVVDLYRDDDEQEASRIRVSRKAPWIGYLADCALTVVPVRPFQPAAAAAYPAGWAAGTYPAVKLALHDVPPSTLADELAPLVATWRGVDTGTWAARLNLESLTSTPIDMILRAKATGPAGNNLSFFAAVGAVALLPSPGGTPTFQYRFADGVTASSDLATKIAALAGANDLIEVDEAGGGVAVWASPDDLIPTTAFAGGATGGVAVQLATGRRRKITAVVVLESAGPMNIRLLGHRFTTAPTDETTIQPSTTLLAASDAGVTDGTYTLTFDESDGPAYDLVTLTIAAVDEGGSTYSITITAED